ncbi:MAG: DDE-type integrase/transposase/recombinase [Beijerinckiaceae bacterium]|nr:DDE-type integrase/transposase/recombinase [Brevundimonas sp.]MCZ8302020.1 DDE-type integrase/transposase/recombinase [Beijerinckiaceae bacterium]
MHDPTETIVTDRFASYGAALKAIGAIDKREVGRWLNNRVENSHQPFRQRERAMLRFRRMRTEGLRSEFFRNSPQSTARSTTTSTRNAHSSRPAFEERRAAALNEWRQLCAA